MTARDTCVSRDEIFHDGLTTYWLVADDQRAANDAVLDVAKADGPFEDYVNVQLVSGRIAYNGQGDARFLRDDEGGLEFWEVDAQ